MPPLIPVSSIESGSGRSLQLAESEVVTETASLSSAASGIAPENATVGEIATGAAPTRWRDLRRYLLARKTALGGLIAFLLIATIALLAPLIAPHDPLQQSLADNFKPPVWVEGGSTTYLLGTDPLGRDLLSRLIYGARYSLMISVTSVLLGGLLGFAIGLISGYFGSWVDTALMRLGDIQLAFPFVLFAIAVLAVSPERTPWQIILVLGLSSWVI